MSTVDRWLLPDGVEDVLPPQAKKLEEVRRRLLDLFETWGYEYVIPPMIEYLDSLLTGTGHDLDLKTFKIVDLLTGRTMGVRADITPQVARIDAHSLNREGVARLCYAGTVVQAQADSMLASRTPLSVGAELFGESNGTADVEIVSLMVESLKSLDVNGIHVDLGDVAIFRQLMGSLALSSDQQELLFAAVQKKAVAEIRSRCAQFDLSTGDTNRLCALPGLTGDADVLARARDLFVGNKGILASIDNLEKVSHSITERFKELNVYFDLSELRGYAYHTGIVFAAYVEGSGRVVAKGGRYDFVGQVFGRGDRGATGFSVDVRMLAEEVAMKAADRKIVLVSNIPGGKNKELWQEIQRLRQSGYIVLESGAGTEYDYELVFNNDKWQLNTGRGEMNHG